ncbi:ABC transporter ATP-binding protein [Aureivirga sp. CE67]|uniref:ABC transporter ATP-binding protein n=1 Tax=Aureivirga sp. CE67 TaxID=1788983 RepID=UPI0018CA4D89|nr:ABC transporter ATP-binding protein [Aureivirga sp. CE67]
MKIDKSIYPYILKEIVWPRRSLVFFGMLLIIIGKLAALVTPWASKRLLDDVFPEKNQHLLTELIIYVIIAVLIQSITSFLLTRLLSVEAQCMITNMRIKVQKRVLSQPSKFFDKHSSGELVSRIMTDVAGIKNIVGTGLVQLAGGFVTAIFSIAILLTISVKLTLYSLIPLVLFVYLTLKGYKIIHPFYIDKSKILASISSRLVESINGIRVIKSYNTEEHELKVFEKGAMRLFENIKKTLTASALVTSSGSLLMGIATVFIFGVGGSMVIKGGITLGDFVSFSLYLSFMISPIIQMSTIGTKMTEALAGLIRTREFLQKKSEQEDEERTMNLPEIQGNFEIKNINFSYIKNIPILKNINFSVPQGSVTAFVGPSGSGKSTLVNLIATFNKIQTGDIILDHKYHLNKIHLNNYRKNLGVVLQDDFLFDGTISENILYSKPEASFLELQNAVKSAFVDEFTDRFKYGLDTVIGQNGMKLSGGQKQRISIARAILKNPKILILDEATSNLDVKSENFIKKSLENLMKNKTTFIIAHRLTTIEKADQILFIEDGEIKERGTHEELIAKKGKYYQMYNFQSRM